MGNAITEPLQHVPPENTEALEEVEPTAVQDVLDMDPRELTDEALDRIVDFAAKQREVWLDRERQAKVSNKKPAYKKHAKLEDQELASLIEDIEL